jgi:phage baseplate assembly protein W
MHVDYPLHFDGRGHTAEADADEYVRDLIEQVLFTSPGERVNRPAFGTGVMQLVFAPASQELSATLQLVVQGALQQWLGDLIQVEQVAAEVQESVLVVVVQYVVRQTRRRQVARFTHGRQQP